MLMHEKNMCDPYILAKMSIRIAVYTHLNENPCTNQEIHVLFEHGSELEKTYNKPCIICMTLYTESVADQTDHFADVFFAKTLRGL